MQVYSSTRGRNYAKPVLQNKKKTNHGNLDVIESIAPNMGKKLQNVKLTTQQINIILKYEY